ncbi:MAG: hypothetical protein ABSB81_08665 [Halobacteriota archaeon]|jgi:hypothetical protein
MESDQEKKNRQEKEDRGHLLVDENRERIRFPSIKIERDSVVYDMGHPETRLIGQINVGSAEYIGEGANRKKLYTDLKQLWRTKDGHYFFYGIGGIDAISTETAHAAMNRDVGYRRFLTDARKKEIEDDDERIKLGKGSGLG